MPLDLAVCIELLQIHYNNALASHFSKCHGVSISGDNI